VTNDKLGSTHLERKAVVYLRQSTAQQLVNCRESTQRQYALAGRAGELGWPTQRIEVIDEDLGRSGTGTVWRTGFQLLARQIAEGSVGAVLALEVSRFARNSADWHQLLDLCGWSSTIIIDEQSIYDPRDPNDRLLLGLKGQMSEAERYWMRLRLQGGLLNKARRGEMRLPPPVGYTWDPVSKAFEMDADERIRGAVALIFERFNIDRSVRAVLRYLVRHHVTLPRRPPGSPAVLWDKPGAGALYRILNNPLYAGAYVYGRRETRPVIEQGRLVRSRQVFLPDTSWKICLRGNHPGYITWEQFMANKQRLDANRADYVMPNRRGAARKGTALLQGMVLCGRCGSRMHVSYSGRDQTSRYECQSAAVRGEDKANCWSVVAGPVDSAVVERFLRVADPPEVDLCLAVTREAERQAAELDRQWRHRLDQVAYEVRLAERRYLTVDPDNRTVARTLEARWEEKLREKEEVDRAYELVRRERRVDLGPREQARIVQLARNLRLVWNAPSTREDQRKNMLRILIQEVALSPFGPDGRGIHVEILWEAGAAEKFDIARPTLKFHVSETARMALKAGLDRGLTHEELARELNEEGVDSGRCRPWDSRLIGHALENEHIKRGPNALVTGARRRADGMLSARAVAERFGVTLQVVRGWADRQLICRAQDPASNRHWYRLDDAAINLIKGEGGPHYGRPQAPEQREDGAVSMRGIAARFGVSIDQARRWLRDGTLVPIARTGNRKQLWFLLDAEALCRIEEQLQTDRARRPEKPPVK
jgi:DNA invertase Pin-like site-specific DNA recombinase